MHRVWSKAALGLLLAWASPAAAKQQRTAVAELLAPPTLSGLATRIAQLVVAEAAKNDKVVGPDEVRGLISPEALRNLQECVGRPDCVAQNTTGLAVDRIVVGWFDKRDANYLVKLWLVDVASHSVVATVDRAILIASRRLVPDVQEALPAFVQGQAEVQGRLKVACNVSGAAVAVDGIAAGKTPLETSLKPGKHVVRISRDGYMPVERYATVTPSETQTLDVKLIALPGVTELVAEEDKKEEPSGASTDIPAASYVAAGLAVAFGTTGGILGAAVRSTQKKAIDSDGDGILEITRAKALSARKNASYANICYAAAGAAAAGALAFYLFGDASPSAPSASLLPVSGGAMAGLSTSF